MSLTDQQVTLLTQCSIALLLALGSSYGIRLLCSRWQKDTGAPVRAVISKAFQVPLGILPWLGFILYLAHLRLNPDEGLNHNEAGWHDNLLVVENALLIMIPAWMLWRLSSELTSLVRVLGPEWHGRVSGSVLSRVCQMLVLMVTLGSVAQMLGYSFSTLLAFGGIGGLIIGMAAKEWLANFFGGLMLMLDRPFAEGDWIRSPDRAIEGHVENIGWRLTRIRTFDRRPIYVPNALFTGIVVENPSRMRNRRMVENFGLRYDDIEKLPMIFSRIMELIEENPDISSSEPKYACFIRYDDSALLCQVRAHINRTDRVGFLQVQQWVLMTIAQVVEEQAAEFAYPTCRLISDPAPTDNNK